MFEQTFVSRGPRGRSPAAIAISLAGQSLILGCLLIAPLLHPQAMRYVLQHSVLELPHRTPKPPEPVRQTTHTVATRSLFHPATLQAPTHVPQRIAMITELAPELALPAASTTSGGSSLPGMLDGLGDIAKPQPVAPPPQPVVKKPPARVRVSSGMQEAMLIHQVKPAYPALARAARVSGTVVLQAEISKDGVIQKLQVVSGHPLLTRAAVEAVAQWRYRPTLLSGEPVEVATQIVVNFVLN